MVVVDSEVHCASVNQSVLIMRVIEVVLVRYPVLAVNLIPSLDTTGRRTNRVHGVGVLDISDENEKNVCACVCYLFCTSVISPNEYRFQERRAEQQFWRECS